MNYQYLTEGGVEQWNRWRKDHPNLFPNLSGVDLSHHYLFEVDLSSMNLRGANLSRACLIGANLSWANLSDANLMGAYLGQADLSSANLHGANLYQANLYSANLLGASFKQANLSHVDLSNTRSSSRPNIQASAQVSNAVRPASLDRRPQKITLAAIDLYSNPHSNISQPLICFVATPHFSSSTRALKQS